MMPIGALSSVPSALDDLSSPNPTSIVAGALIMYDRLISLGRHAPRPVAEGGPTEAVPVPVFGQPLYMRKHRKRLRAAAKATTNRISLIPTPAIRGEVIDANGVVLAHNYPAYSLEIVPSQLEVKTDDMIEALRAYVDITDGDLRRAIESGQDLRQHKAHELMRPRARTIGVDALAAQAAELMEQHRISCLLVLDDQGRLCGALNTHDLMRAKVI